MDSFGCNGLIGLCKAPATNQECVLSIKDLETQLPKFRDKAHMIGLKFLWRLPTKYCQFDPLHLRSRSKCTRINDKRLRGTKRRCLPVTEISWKHRQHHNGTMEECLASSIGRKTTQKNLRGALIQGLFSVTGLWRRLPIGTGKQRALMYPDRIIYL